MSKPCNIVRNDIDVCDELDKSLYADAFLAFSEHAENGAERFRIQTFAGGIAIKFCPFCGAPIVPPYTPNEAP